MSEVLAVQAWGRGADKGHGLGRWAVAPRTDSEWLRRRIGRELRALRESAPDRLGRKITTAQAADELGCTQPKVTSIELGKHRLQWRDVRDLLVFYQAADTEAARLVSWAKRSSEPIWWEPYAEVVEDWFADLVGGEGEATREITYEHGLIPGLLQTEAYAEVLTRASSMVSKEHRDLVVELRMERQHRLLEGEPLELVALIEESVLDRPVGTGEIMKQQLGHLLVMSKQKNVTVQVVPTSAGVHPAVDGAFILLEFGDFPPSVFVQHHTAIGGQYSDDQVLVDTFRIAINDVRKMALSPRDSASLICARADQYS